MLARTKRLKKFLRSFFQKATEGAGRVALHHGISFVSFSLCLFWQRKAAKESWYLRIVPQIITNALPLPTFSLTK
jgi:hypothetical protein